MKRLALACLALALAGTVAAGAGYNEPSLTPLGGAVALPGDVTLVPGIDPVFGAVRPVPSGGYDVVLHAEVLSTCYPYRGTWHGVGLIYC